MIRDGKIKSTETKLYRFCIKVSESGKDVVIEKEVVQFLDYTQNTVQN